MLSSSRQKLFLSSLLLLLLISIPLTVSLLQRKQEERSRAAGSTTLYFIPESTTTAPITKNVGENIALDLTVDPGNHLVTFVKFQVKFDPTKIQLATDPFTINTTSFPTKVEGPVTASDSLAESVSIGSDPTKAIQNITKVGTVNFKAIGPTDSGTTSVTFTQLSQVLSGSSTDQASENVLSTTTPAYIKISGNGQYPTATPSAITPSTTPETTTLNLILLLHGVGAAGDNANPGGASMSNKNPLHPQRNLEVKIIDSTNQIVADATSAVVYNGPEGKFVGVVDLGKNFPAGNYTLKVKTDRYLRKLVPGVIQVKNLTENKVPDTSLVAGDINDDNYLNVLDYNGYLDCGYGDIEPLPMEDANATYHTAECQAHTPVINVDTDDNGIINSADYNLFVRELSVQNGD